MAGWERVRELLAPGYPITANTITLRRKTKTMMKRTGPSTQCSRPMVRRRKERTANCLEEDSQNSVTKKMATDYKGKSG